MDQSRNINEKLIEIAKGITPKIRYLKKLLIEGADINFQTLDNSYTALMFVVKCQNDRIAEYLLRQGADPLIRNHENKIASALISPDNTIYPVLKDFELLTAVFNDDLLTTEAVITAGALVNFKSNDGYTALMIAVEKNYEEMVEFLLLQGADPTITLPKGHGIFDLTKNPSIHQLLEDAISWSQESRLIPEKKLHGFFQRAGN
ncbi:MAG: ankyrin repeat domain-containing protein [Tatlockia sp.]|nr:ankyrin repeat domain-containing protein [Tatlockia sp.]